MKSSPHLVSNPLKVYCLRPFTILSSLILALCLQKNYSLHFIVGEQEKKSIANNLLNRKTY